MTESWEREPVGEALEIKSPPFWNEYDDYVADGGTFTYQEWIEARESDEDFEIADISNTAQGMALDGKYGVVPNSEVVSEDGTVSWDEVAPSEPGCVESNPCLVKCVRSPGLGGVTRRDYYPLFGGL